MTEPKQAATVLRRATIEMETRLKKLAEPGVRNIDQYNKIFEPDSTLNLFDTNGERERPLPYLVIVIDELADLMMVEPQNVEESITRLAQMARAVGIHLILATQRPSVDVITGLIKANLPSRISFRVASKVDSRTILDSNGAEALLGKGDMLFMPPGTSRLLRLHGPLGANRRIPTRAVEIGSRKIGARERISLMWVSANRDARVFEDPQAFRLDRDPAANLLYGKGIHVCPGAPLARIEMRVVMEELLGRTTRFSLMPGKPPTVAVYPASGFAVLPMRIE